MPAFIGVVDEHRSLHEKAIAGVLGTLFMAPHQVSRFMQRHPRSACLNNLVDFESTRARYGAQFLGFILSREASACGKSTSHHDFRHSR